METIGKKLWYYRGKRGISRKKLVDGICNESTLFRTEKGNTLPSMFILDALCKKLNIPLSLLFDEDFPGKKHSIVYLKQRCRKHVYNKDFDNLAEDIDNFKTLIRETDLQNRFHTLFITWHEAIVLNEKYNQPVLAKQMLLNSLPNKVILETEISMMNVLGLICVSMEEKEEALSCFQKAFQAAKNIPFLEDQTLYVRIGYNLASRLYYLGNYQQVVQLADELICFLKNYHLFYLKGRTFHMLAKSHEKIGDHELAEKFMENAVAIFSIEGKKEYLQKAQKDLKEIRL